MGVKGFGDFVLQLSNSDLDVVLPQQIDPGVATVDGIIPALP